MMDHYKRAGKYCTGCHEEFSNRYFKRHCCKQNRANVEKSRNDQSDHEPMVAEIPSTSDGYLELRESEVSSLNAEASPESDDNLEDVSSDDGEDTFLDDELLEMYIAADSDENSETYTETDNNEYIQTILKLLFRWQAIFFISDMALSFVIMLLKSVLYLCSFSSSTFMTALYRIFSINFVSGKQFNAF